MVYLTLLDECLIATECTQISPHAHVLFALGLYLIIQRGQRVPRDTIASLLWPNTSTHRSRRCLRRALWKLRSNGFPVNGENGPHLFIPKQAAVIDTDSLVHQDASTLAHKAFDVLPWYEPHCSAKLRDWVDDLRNATRLRVLQQLHTVIEHAEHRADWQGSLQLAERILTLDPSSTLAREARNRAQTALQTPYRSQTFAQSLITSNPHTPLHLQAPYPTHVAEATPQSQYQSRQPDQITPSKALTPLVGREGELDLMTHLLEHAAHGSGGGMYLWGPAGIGKSRLIGELHRLALTQNAVVHVANLQEHDAKHHWSVLQHIVPQLKQAPGAAGCDPALASYLDQLIQSHIRAPTTPSPLFPATCIYNYTQSALFDLVEAISEEQPIVVILENAQWMDGPSQTIIANLIAWATTRHVLVVCTAHTQPADGFVRTSRQALTLHHLSALTANAAVQLAKAYVHMHQHASDDTVIQWCISVSEGNPYLLEELLAHWIRTGEQFCAPATLTTLIKARIAQLSDTARTFLQASAILGDDATYDRLQKMFNSSRPEFFSALEELGASGLLTSYSSNNDESHGTVQVRCRHDLIRDVTLDALSYQGREVLHAHAASVLEQEMSAPQCAL